MTFIQWYKNGLINLQMRVYNLSFALSNKNTDLRLFKKKKKKIKVKKLVCI